MSVSTHILIVEAPYYTHIGDELIKGALQALGAAGATHEKITVPGAFEIPAAIHLAASSQNADGKPHYDGFVALGCVIRGETTHYDYVCQESARGLQELALWHDLAIGFGILTVENEAQALARADISRKNKGGEAVKACLSMIELKRRFRHI